jgi:hypothetical protein
MEHRWGKRSALDIGVKLHLGPGAVNAGCITDASLSGAFVRTASRLRVFTHVLTELDGGSPRESESQRIPAYVVRAASDGLGLEWSEFAPPGIATLLACAASDCELTFRLAGLSHSNSVSRQRLCRQFAAIARCKSHNMAIRSFS